MLELTDILIIVVVFLVLQILFLRLIVFALRKLAPQLGAGAMEGAAANIPKINIMQAAGYGLYKFIEGGGIQFILEKWLGVKPPPGGGSSG